MTHLSRCGGLTVRMLITPMNGRERRMADETGRRQFIILLGGACRFQANPC
jgi:hypothetical protein